MLKFFFFGFLPHKKGRKKILEHLSKFDGTIVLFENPKRLKRTLNDIYIHHTDIIFTLIDPAGSQLSIGERTGSGR